MADAVVSSLMHDAGRLFDGEGKGVAFTLLRHPVERGASLFYYLQEVRWGRRGGEGEEWYDPALANVTIEEYFRDWRGESDWMVRY